MNQRSGNIFFDAWINIFATGSHVSFQKLPAYSFSNTSIFNPIL